MLAVKTGDLRELVEDLPLVGSGRFEIALCDGLNQFSSGLQTQLPPGCLDKVEPMSKRPVMIISGASRGIGAATARLTAGRGYAICVNYVSGRDTAENLVRQITDSGERAVAIQADVGVEMRLNAMSADRLSLIFAVNVLGPMVCARGASKGALEAFTWIRFARGLSIQGSRPKAERQSASTD